MCAIFKISQTSTEVQSWTSGYKKSDLNLVGSPKPQYLPTGIKTENNSDPPPSCQFSGLRDVHII